MARLAVQDDRIQILLAQKLIPMLLRLGSVNALCELLNRALDGGKDAGRLYPNRLHAILGEGLARTVNESTLSLIERASAKVDFDSLPAADDMRTAEWKERVKREWESGSRTVSEIQKISRAVSLPASVVRHLLSLDGGATPSAGEANLASGATAAPGRGGRRVVMREPDWNFQETALRKCRESLGKGPDRKVGLVVPTGGGKTRIALTIAMHTLHDDGTGRGKVVWVTHRKNLYQQAHRELQKMLSEGPLKLPEDATRLLGQRIEFIMISQLEERLEAPEDILLVIVDEAHHAAAPSYQAIFDCSQPLRMLALTATPNRTDELPIGIDEIAFYITYRELVDRGVIIMPTFEDFPVEDFDWTPESIENLADYVIEESKDRFRKTLVIAPRIDRVEEFYEALKRKLAKEAGHPLGLDDLGFLHSERNSMGVSQEDFLDSFCAKPRAVIVSAQMLLEGFDDPLLNSVVITYPSTSLVLLMQAAGRCVRFSTGKTQAFVVQARKDALAYHFEQRWLYQEISDLLRPRLVDLPYKDPADLRRQIEAMLKAYSVPEELGQNVITQMAGVSPGQTCRMLLFGLPYAGDPTSFNRDAEWGAFLETPSNSDAFRFIFNQFCSAGAELNDLEPFLSLAGRNFGLRKDLEGFSEWVMYSHILVSMRYARKEIYGYHGEGPFAKARPYVKNSSTTWLTYVTFHYEPAVPPVLDQFLQDCYNREEVLASYTADSARWTLAIKIPVPLGGAEAHLLDEVRAGALQTTLRETRDMLSAVPPKDRFSALAGALTKVTIDLPARIAMRIEYLLEPDSGAARTLDLKVQVAADGLPTAQHPANA